MSTNAAAPTEKTPKRLHPYQISIAIGLGVGTFALFSGIVKLRSTQSFPQ
jgi:hypothetical protein